MAGRQVTELDTLPSFTDTSLLPVHNGAGLKKGALSQLAKYIGTKFSNPNLLINPDFKINQRGQATYETSGASQIYSADRWRLGRGKVTVNSDGTVTVTATGGTTNEEGYYQQYLENAISGDYTVSMEVISVSGAVRIAIDGAWKNIKSGLNVFHGITGTGAVGLQLANGASITLKWIKLEQGLIATPFVAPNHAEELTKCYRYKYIGGANLRARCTENQVFGFTKDLPTTLRIAPTMTFKSKYSYNVNSINLSVKDGNNTVYISGTAETTNQSVIEVVLDLDAEIY